MLSAAVAFFFFFQLLTSPSQEGSEANDINYYFQEEKVHSLQSLADS